ncbi:unnamed protein product [Meloidogyne enterolobii]|uniref:Uncharacterized protein n=1 Tax=Meloidogyne enterolobii TaxID=390850 RepID=A0ACB1A9K0_MELEN
MFSLFCLNLILICLNLILKLFLVMFLIIILILIKLFSHLSASDDEERLMMDVFRGYNSLILPMRNDSQPIIVKMTLQLILLINVDEKDQIMHTNVWLTLKWKDYQMKWSPVNYGGIKDIRVPPDKVWLPDIVPPAIYKSSCIIGLFCMF